jgi:hypothetical protein
LETRALANFGPHGPAKADRASPSKVTRPANLSVLETRALANFDPNDPAKADRAPPPTVTRPANLSVLETRAPANPSPPRPPEPCRRHYNSPVHCHEPLLQHRQDRRHPQQLRLNLSDAHVLPPTLRRCGPRPLRLRRDLRINSRGELRDDLRRLLPTDSAAWSRPTRSSAANSPSPRTASTRAASSAVSTPRTRRSSRAVAGVAGVAGTSTPAAALVRANRYSRRLLSVCARARQLAEQNFVSRRFAMNGLPHSSFSHGLTTVSPVLDTLIILSDCRHKQLFSKIDHSAIAQPPRIM